MTPLTPKILSDQIWINVYFWQPLACPYFIIFNFDFLCNSLKPKATRKAVIHTNRKCELKFMEFFL